MMLRTVATFVTAHTFYASQETWGAYQKSELAGRSGHFENEIGFFREFSFKTHHCYAYYVEIK